MIFLEGEVQTRKWQDQDGNDRYTTEVVVQGYNCNLTLLDSRNNSNNTIENQTNISQNVSDSDNSLSSTKTDASDDDDDIPF